MTEITETGERMCCAADLDEVDASYLRRICENEGYGTVREAILSMWAEAVAEEGYWRPGWAEAVVRQELGDLARCGEHVPTPQGEKEP